MKCPCCGEQVNPEHFSCKSGAIGGKKTGPTKARDPEAMRRASALGVAARKAIAADKKLKEKKLQNPTVCTVCGGETDGGSCNGKPMCWGCYEKGKIK